MSMSGWLKDIGRKARPGHARSMFTPRNTTSVILSKGLLNAPGDNNCFLNSAVQVLWHLDVFRRSFREMKGHACMGKACIFCALKALFNQLQNSEEQVLPPDALRKALASAFKDQLRFQLGCMDDAAECFENILVRIHFHLAHNIKEDLCDAKHCIPHRKFAMTLIEHSVCKCGATSEPFPFTQMVHYISSTALCNEAHKMREHKRWPNTDHFGVLLRKAGAVGDLRACPSSCGRKIEIRRLLMNCPDVVSIGLIWDSDKPDIEHICDVISNLGTILLLRELFDDTVDDRAKANSLFLVGIVTYYGRHYTTFFYNTNRRHWIYFDDAVVKEVGPNWSDVVDRCRRGHFQPLLLLYAYPDGKAVSSATAPKRISMLKGYEKDDKENAVPTGHLGKPQDSLSSKMSSILCGEDEPVPIYHDHGNSTSSNGSSQGFSAQSESSTDSQSTLVYQPVGKIPECRATSAPEDPSAGNRNRVSRKHHQDWHIGEDGSVANATRASWIPNSIVEIGHDALNYVPMKKSGGTYAISQFALQGHDDREESSGTGSNLYVKSAYLQDATRVASSAGTSAEVPDSRGQTAFLQTGRPSSAKPMHTSFDHTLKPPLSPQVQRPSSAHGALQNHSTRQMGPLNTLQATTLQRDNPVVSRSGAVYNAQTGTITGCNNAQQTTLDKQKFPQPNLTLQPFGNFSTEVEFDPPNKQGKKLDIKPLQEFKADYMDSSNQFLQRTPLVRQGSWSGGSSGQYAEDNSVQRCNSMNIAPLGKYQDSHSSAPNLNDAGNAILANRKSHGFSSHQNHKPSSVPDLHYQARYDRGIQSGVSSSVDPMRASKPMQRVSPIQSDQQISPGGILAQAMRNQEPRTHAQSSQDTHVPLVRTSSVTDRRPDERQTRAKYNMHNGFLTLPGKRQANQFMSSGKQSANPVQPKDGGSTGVSAGCSPHAQVRGVPQLNRQPSNERKSLTVSLQNGLALRQTPEVPVTHGHDIDSIASRDSGYRSRDRSSASSGSVYSLDAPLSDTSVASVPGTTANSHQVSSSAPHLHGHVHQSTGAARRSAGPRSQTPTKHPPQSHVPPPNDSSSDTPLLKHEGVVNDLVKGVEEQLLSSRKAEGDGDLAMALGLCTAAASTLKIALRLDGLRDQTKLFLQTKYNTTVLKSRSLHRKLTLLRRSEEQVPNKNSPPPPPTPDPTRSSPVRREVDMGRHEHDSLQEIELLKKRVADFHLDQSNKPHPNRQYQPSGGGTEVDTASVSLRGSYQPQQHRSVPSSPASHRSKQFSNRPPHHGMGGAMDNSGMPGTPHEAKVSKGMVSTGHLSPHGVVKSSQNHKDWVLVGSGTTRQSTTPHDISSRVQQAGAADASQYHSGRGSQTPTAYFGTSKPSEGHFSSAVVGPRNRNNNATYQQPTLRTNGQFSTGREVQGGADNPDWVQRRDPPRHGYRNVHQV